MIKLYLLFSFVFFGIVFTIPNQKDALADVSLGSTDGFTSLIRIFIKSGPNAEFDTSTSNYRLRLAYIAFYGLIPAGIGLLSFLIFFIIECCCCRGVYQEDGKRQVIRILAIISLIFILPFLILSFVYVSNTDKKAQDKTNDINDKAKANDAQLYDFGSEFFVHYGTPGDLIASFSQNFTSTNTDKKDSIQKYSKIYYDISLAILVLVFLSFFFIAFAIFGKGIKFTKFFAFFLLILICIIMGGYLAIAAGAEDAFSAAENQESGIDFFGGCLSDSILNYTNTTLSNEISANLVDLNNYTQPTYFDQNNYTLCNASEYAPYVTEVENILNQTQVSVTLGDEFNSFVANCSYYWSIFEPYTNDITPSAEVAATGLFSLMILYLFLTIALFIGHGRWGGGVTYKDPQKKNKNKDKNKNKKSKTKNKFDDRYKTWKDKQKEDPKPPFPEPTGETSSDEPPKYKSKSKSESEKEQQKSENVVSDREYNTLRRGDNITIPQNFIPEDTDSDQKSKSQSRSRSRSRSRSQSRSQSRSRSRSRSRSSDSGYDYERAQQQLDLNTMKNRNPDAIQLEFINDNESSDKDNIHHTYHVDQPNGQVDDALKNYNQERKSTITANDASISQILDTYKKQQQQFDQFQDQHSD